MEKWEQVAKDQVDDTTHWTARLKVPGGWLYRVEVDTPISENARTRVLAITFVPDTTPEPKKLMVRRQG